MAAPTIDLYTGAIPDRANDSATEFSDNADDMVTYIAEIPDQYNDLAEFVNSAASSAQAAANFEGGWSELSGAYPAGISVEHSGMTWLLLVALSDITASEPSSTNTDWQALASFAQQDQNTDDIAEINENLQVENRFKGNQNWNVEGSTGSTLPNAVARTYTDGEEIAAGRFADGNVVNATLVDYVFDADSGTYYIEYNGDFTDNFYGLKLTDGSITQIGCTLSLVSGNTRLSVDMGVAPAHEFPVLSEFSGNYQRINNIESYSVGTIDRRSLAFGVTFNGGTVNAMNELNLNAIIKNSAGVYTIEFARQLNVANAFYSASCENSTSSYTVGVSNLSEFGCSIYVRNTITGALSDVSPISLVIFGTSS